MRIALICRPFSFHGGVETATAGLMRELVSHGYEVDLLTTRGETAVPGVTIRTLPVLSQPSVLRLLSFGMSAAVAVRSRPYDIVHSHERCFRQDIYRAGEGTHRGYLAAMGRRGVRANPYHRTVLALEARIFRLKGAREIVAISRQGKDEIQRLYGTPPDRVRLVYNGVDLVRFHPDHRGRPGPGSREALGLPREAWTILFVGSGFERKGLGPLIEAVSRLSDGGARLVVAGKGQTSPYQDLAARLGVAERVTWLGPRRDVETLYGVADLVALPARYEPFGNVHLEALASGLPVLTSSTAGGSELIRDGENGWVVREPTAAAISAGLERLRTGDPMKLMIEARASAEPFTYAAQVGRLTEIYRRLAR